jgi:glycosyltransferase involved in cell wall biosynthesis
VVTEGTMSVDISVVIPVRNEELNVPRLYEELTATLQGSGRRYEIIVIDDGSTDETFTLLAALQARDPRLRIIRFRRNFGQTAAFSAGFAHARGRFIVTSDGDLQNDPRDIPAMLEVAEGVDIVAGWRKNRQDAFINRRLPSMIANWIISHVTGVKLHDYGCSLKVFRAEVVKPMRLYGEMHRFIPIYAKWSGARITEQVVRHHPRLEGKSKYGLGRLLKVILDLMTVKFLGDYSTKPLYMFGRWGILMILWGVLCGTITLAEKWMNPMNYAHRNPLLLLAVMLFMVGMQLIGMGLLAELQVRTYHESQHKPVYLVAEELSGDAAAAASAPRGLSSGVGSA